MWCFVTDGWNDKFVKKYSRLLKTQWQAKHINIYKRARSTTQQLNVNLFHVDSFPFLFVTTIWRRRRRRRWRKKRAWCFLFAINARRSIIKNNFSSEASIFSSFSLKFLLLPSCIILNSHLFLFFYLTWFFFNC